MSTIGTVELIAKIDTSQYKRGASEIDKANKDMESSGEKSTSKLSGAFAGVAKVGIAALATAVIAVGALIVSNIGSAITRVDTLANSSRTFDNMGFKTEEVAKSMKALEASIMGLPTSLDAGVRGMTSLAATYGDVSKGQKVFSALNNAILGFGGTASMVENAILQVSQVPMDGPLDAQTWNSLRNSGLTPVLVAMAKDMGIGISEMKEKFGEGELKVRDFTDALIKMDSEGGGGMKSLSAIAQDSTKGIATSFANMQTAITRGISKIVEAIGRENIAGFITNIGKGLESALKVFATAIPAMIGYAKSLFEFLKPTLEVIGTVILSALIPAIDSLKQSFQEIYEVTKPYHEQIKMVAQFIGAVLIGVIVLFGAALLGLVVVIAKVIEWGAKFVSFMISMGISVQETMNNMNNSVRNTVSNIANWFGSLPRAIANAVGNLGSVLYGAGRDLIQGLLNGAASLLNTVGSFFASKLPGTLQGPFKKALGINSPSKVFAEYGMNIAQGLAGGVDKYSSLASKAIGNLASDVTMTMTPKVNTAALDSNNASSSYGKTEIHNHFNGVLASSQSDLRTVGKMIMGSIDQERIAKQQTPIMGGA